VRNTEIIGEAAHNIPPELQKQYAEVPWSQIIGMRNIVIHAYFGIDKLIIWTVATQDLPKLRPTIELMLKTSKNDLVKFENLTKQGRKIARQQNIKKTDI